MHMYPLYRFFSHLSHYRALSRISCAIQQVPISYLFYIQYCVYGRRRWHPTPVLLPGKFHGQRSLVGCSPWGHEELDTTGRLPFHFSLSCIGEGNGNPLQCSWLENPRDGGAWWAAVYGVAELDTTEVTQQQHHTVYVCQQQSSSLSLSPYPLVTIILFSVSVTLFVFQISSFVSFFRFYIQAIPYDICLSLSELLHSV